MKGCFYHVVHFTHPTHGQTKEVLEIVDVNSGVTLRAAVFINGFLQDTIPARLSEREELALFRLRDKKRKEICK